MRCMWRGGSTARNMGFVLGLFGLLGPPAMAGQSPVPSPRDRNPRPEVTAPARGTSVPTSPGGSAADDAGLGVESAPVALPAALEGREAKHPAPAPQPGPPEPSPPPSDLAARLRTARPIYPIDLAGALKLAGARDLEIAIARERIAVAVAQLQGARVQWLPSFFVGPSWARHDGQIQDNLGNVFTTSRSSLFIGGTAAAGGPVYAPPPGGGTAPVSSFATVLRISDAIFGPLAARQVVNARQARLAVTTNDVLLELTEAYFDLQAAAGRVAIAQEALGHAETLVDLTGSYAQVGTGLEADYQRSLTERQRQRQALAGAVGRWKVASSGLVRRTRLDPRIVVAPIEPPESLVRIVSPTSPLDDLIVAGLRSRPELAEAQAMVEATLTRLKQARLRPLVPSVALRISAGGFGGGVNDFFGNFGGRQDTDVNLYWELQNFGLGDRAIARARAAEQRTATFERIRAQDRVAAEVAAAYEESAAAEERLRENEVALKSALDSLRLNLDNIREGAGLPRATRPIEVLQPIQALAQARGDYLEAALDFNRAQFRLYRALGWPANLPGPTLPPPPGPAPLLAPGPVFAAPTNLHVRDR